MKKNFSNTKVFAPLLAVLAISPMSHSSTNVNSSSFDETTAFNAKSRIRFFEEKFDFFGFSFYYWCFSLIGDNASSNKKAATLIGKPHVGCASHKLELEIRHNLRNAVFFVWEMI